jgi:hypothetical protein
MLEMSIPTVECGTDVLHPLDNLTFYEDEGNKKNSRSYTPYFALFVAILIHDIRKSLFS